MIKFKLLAALLFCALFVLSCNPNDDISGNAARTGFSENFGTKVARDFIGQIVDINKMPIQNVTVTIGNKTVQTDVNGVFIINKADVFEQFAYIRATKSGFIDGSRSMVPTVGKNNVIIMMIPNTPIEYIQSGTVSQVTLPNGTRVKFDGYFQDSYGRNYSGSVGVSVFHLATSDENINSLMPGMLYAEDKNGQEKVLETYGMLNVELYGSDGQKLQIATGHTAEIKLHIDDTQLASAPNTIPLWHFDEENGYWKEEGEATRQGNVYVGKVSHFSWWNCDVPFPSVALTVNVMDSKGNPASFLILKLVANNNPNSLGFGYTNNVGQNSGFVPINTVFTLLIYGTCGEVIYTSSVGPFSENTTLPTIVITPAVLSTTISGNLLKCDNSIVTNGYVVYYRSDGSHLIAAVTEGHFNFNSFYCSGYTDFSLKGFDYDTLQSTDDIQYNFTPNTTIVGNLSACTSITEFISYKIDNNPVVFLLDDLFFSINSFNQIGVYGHNYSLQKLLSIDGNATGSGINSLSYFNLYGTDFGIISSGTSNTISYNAAPIGPIGSYVDVTFNGTFTDSTATHTLTGLIHLKRDN